MVSVKSRLKYYSMLVVACLVLISCRTQEEMETEFLRELGINGKSDFEVLSTCDQVRIYSNVASKFTDLEHMVTIVPVWMDEEIAKQPRETLSECILQEMTRLLAEWEKLNNSKKEISSSIHGLFYKVDGLSLLEYQDIDSIFQGVICSEELLYNQQLVLIYYVDKFGVEEFPNYPEMLSAICK